MTAKKKHPQKSRQRTLTDGSFAAMRFAIGREIESASFYNKYQSLAIAVRTRLMDRWLETEKRYRETDAKRVYYLSLEFLMGRTLQNSILNLDIEEEAREAVRQMGMVLEDVYEEEHDAGLGNGGLGRLAACFLDSMATLNIPAKGYGIRYEYGIFNQLIKDGFQVEKPDYWLFRGNPWETPRVERMQRVRFYGHTRPYTDEDGKYRVDWVETDEIYALPHEIPIPGYHTETVNLLTLWSVRAGDEFNLEYFNHGDYLKAVEQQTADENISKVLYPNDNIAAGKELRLKQEYFFASASLQEILDSYLREHNDVSHLPDHVAIQLNDTHPAIAIPEMMHLLMDEHNFTWETAWDLTIRTFAYTNHTLLPEALETWEVGLLERLLPRHLEIIYEINRRFLADVSKAFPNDTDMVRRLSIIEEGTPRRVRMAHLAVVGSHSVNGVAALHTRLLKESLLKDFYRLWPEKFNNKTNGVTQRRWLKQANPALSRLISEHIGDGWVTNLDALQKLLEKADDSAFRDNWHTAKEMNKMVLAQEIKEALQIEVDSASMFDVQVKRIHEYKRQLLNALGVAARYFRIKSNPGRDCVARTVIIGGKAAPGYYMAKLIIKLINDIGKLINNDPDTSRLLKLIFLPNYGVSLAERIFPASDLSEQISTAGMEASGTGNMKFALNGALTIGTLDGANIEIRDAVGEENIFIFGMNDREVMEKKRDGYNPWDYYNQNSELRQTLDAIHEGIFSPDEPERFSPIFDSLLRGGDPYMILADFTSYTECQDRVDDCYRNTNEWTRKSIINVAKMGYFSSDRTIREYAEDIWKVNPVGP
ncbi:MAG: glycogen/starch/alpha-glucan phosphorylase [Pseudomonadota bacterium]|nr:glycogen/starch/alpha-glucan phosphorylase [Pseudomonadota bacterium]MBU0990804.1 glycogen/starch/alpha-glucan phosphorylase [Pseudomonadota bacterium]